MRCITSNLAGRSVFLQRPREGLKRSSGHHRDHVIALCERPSQFFESTATPTQDGGPPGPPPDGNGSYGYGDDEDEPGNSRGSQLSLVLTAARRGLDSLPADLQSAYTAGQLHPSMLQRYIQLDSSWFFRLFLPMQGFRDRLMADPSFFVKVGIECGIGIFTKCAAEYEKRKGRFAAELDFVTANVIMAIIADFMLVWLPAPTMSFTSARSCVAPRSKIAQFFACCPDNAFQKVPRGFPPWSLGQRLAAPIRNGGKLLIVGFSASMLGVTITNGLIALRRLWQPDFAPPNSPQNPLVMSAAYASYMATSSNLRYQVLAGVLEERGIETLFAGQHRLCHGLSFAMRTANTFLGSLMWVDYIRLLGLQPKTESKDDCCQGKAKRK